VAAGRPFFHGQRRVIDRFTLVAGSAHDESLRPTPYVHVAIAYMIESEQTTVYVCIYIARPRRSNTSAYHIDQARSESEIFTIDPIRA
jgi:hypothetical protein